MTLTLSASRYSVVSLLLCCCWFWMAVDGWMQLATHATTTTIRRTLHQPIISTAQYAKKSSPLTLDPVSSEEQLQRQKTTIAESTTPPPTPLFWYNASDPILFHYDNDNDDPNNNRTLTGLQFRIRGNPMPLQRHRQTRRGFVYNPSSSAQTLFAQVLEAQLSVKSSFVQVPPQRPLFSTPHHVPLHMSCHFYLKRSQSDFVANTRGRPIKASRLLLNQWSTTPRTPDVDNLAKFVLDSFNGLLYEDDQQIVSLSVTKMRDNEGDCLGYTDIHISVLN